MFTNFKKYFNLETNNCYNDAISTLENFRNEFSGLVLYDGILKILNRRDVHKWRSNINLAFPRFANKFEPFAFDWLGSFYCVKLTQSTKPAIFIFNILQNRCLLVPCDLITFLEKEIPQNSTMALQSHKFNQWKLSNQPLKYNECVGYTVPVFLGGVEILDSSKVFDLDEYWQIFTDLLDERPYEQVLQEHYEFYLGRNYTTIKNTNCKMEQEYPEFAVLKFPPTLEFPMWRYTTLNMSNFDEVRPIELYVVSKEEHDFIADILTWVAYFRKKGNLLYVDDSVEIGEPWYNDSSCDCGLICYPYIETPEFKDCGDISCLWLLPVTKTEVAFKDKYGIGELEEKFANCELNFLDYFRDSAV